MIFKCSCGNIKTGQPYTASGVSRWVCSSSPQCQRTDIPTTTRSILKLKEARHGPQLERSHKNVAR